MAITAGVNPTNVANKWLTVLSGTTFTAIAAMYVQLHTNVPGAACTTAVSSVTTRPQITWGAPSATCVMTASNQPAWTNWAGTDGEVVTHLSLWTAASGGSPLWSGILGSSRTMHTGDTLTLTACTLAITGYATDV